MIRPRIALLTLFSCCALVILLAAVTRPTPAKASDSPAASPAPPPTTSDATAAQRTQPVRPALGSLTYEEKRGRYVAPYGDARAVLTVSPRLQQGLEKLLAGYHVPMGAAVLLEPSSGRVLAMAEHVERGPATHVALQPIAPAASIFKIVTAAALLERGVTPESEVCYHGGKHRIQKALLSDNPRRDRRCLTLSSAFGKSANVVFAKLAGRTLTVEQLRSEANRFLFDASIPFEWELQPSPAHISGDQFEFATTAAGFGPVRLSPLHGAVLASLVANGGVLVPPRLVESLEGSAWPLAVDPSRQVLRPEIAAMLAEMMETTTTEGTARKVFRGERRRRSPLREVRVAGKTGSLAENSRDYSWFVGFAPAENPKVAVAVVIGNERLWRVKAPFVAREALKAYFEDAAGSRVRTASLDPRLVR